MGLSSGSPSRIGNLKVTLQQQQKTIEPPCYLESAPGPPQAGELGWRWLEATLGRKPEPPTARQRPEIRCWPDSFPAGPASIELVNLRSSRFHQCSTTTRTSNFVLILVFCLFPLRRWPTENGHQKKFSLSTDRLTVRNSPHRPCRCVTLPELSV